MQAEIKICLGSYIYIRKNRLLDKYHIMSQEGSLHNDKWLNPLRRYNICKYLYTQPRGT